MKHRLFLSLLFFAVSLVSVQYFLAQADAIPSEGIFTIESNVVNHINYTGQGVKIAVIDTGFDVTNTEISANIANYTSFRPDGDITAGNNIRHGTAVADIVLDVAPDAELYLYNYNSTNPTTFESMVDHIISLGDIDIITMSMYIPNVGPYDGTSRVLIYNCSELIM